MSHNDANSPKNDKLWVILVLVPLGLFGFIYLLLKHGIGSALIFTLLYGGISAYKFIKNS